MENEKEKTEWQKTKEGWYDKVPLTVRQLDFIIWGSLGALAVLLIKAFVDSGMFG